MCASVISKTDFQRPDGRRQSHHGNWKIRCVITGVRADMRLALKVHASRMHGVTAPRITRVSHCDGGGLSHSGARHDVQVGRELGTKADSGHNQCGDLTVYDISPDRDAGCPDGGRHDQKPLVHFHRRAIARFQFSPCHHRRRHRHHRACPPHRRLPAGRPDPTTSTHRHTTTARSLVGLPQVRAAQRF